jgi:hypothetical protein
MIQNESTFLQSDENVYIFCAKDKHHDTCSKSFQLQNDLNFTTRLHKKIQVKKNMLVEPCVGTYSTHNGWVNGTNGSFQASNKLLNSQ